MIANTRIRSVDRIAAAPNPEQVRGYCAHPGCEQPTSDRKRWCFDHIECAPYVRRLQAELARRDAEDRAAQNHRARIDPNGSRAREILDVLALRGAQTIERIAIEVHLSGQAVRRFIAALEKAGLVKTMVVGTGRGGPRQLVLPARTDSHHDLPRPNFRSAS